jgi:hypothetical protein
MTTAKTDPTMASTLPPPPDLYVSGVFESAGNSGGGLHSFGGAKSLGVSLAIVRSFFRSLVVPQ